MSTETQSLRMAKASPSEVDQWRTFFDQLQTRADDLDMDVADLGVWVIEQLSELGSIDRILLGYETLVANVCDPVVEYLDLKPTLKVGIATDALERVVDLAERVVMQATALQEQFNPDSYEVPAAALDGLAQALQALEELPMPNRPDEDDPRLTRKGEWISL